MMKIFLKKCKKKTLLDESCLYLQQEKQMDVMNRLFALLFCLVGSMLMSVHMVAQTEGDGGRLSGKGTDVPPVDITKSLLLDSVHLRTEMMRPNVSIPKVPTLQSYTQLTKQGGAGLVLWRGASMGFYGATDMKPGLMTTETGMMTLHQDIGRWHFTASGTVNKYWMPWQHMLSTQYGFGGTVGYQLSDAITLNAFGYYYANQLMVGPAMSPYMNSSTYGGYADIRFNRTFGANMGVRRYVNPMTGKWTTEPIVNPYIKIGDSKLEFPLGGILKTLIGGNEDAPRQFRPHPMSHPEVRKR